MKEVIIAVKKEETLGLYITLSVVGLITCLIGCFVMDGMLFPLVIFGLIFLVIGVVPSWQILKMPKIIITFDGENLILPNSVTYPLKELTKVNYAQAHARGMTYQWGTIKLTFGEEELEYNYVADVEEVHDKLMKLRLEKTEG